MSNERRAGREMGRGLFILSVWECCFWLHMKLLSVGFKVPLLLLSWEPKRKRCDFSKCLRVWKQCRRANTNKCCWHSSPSYMILCGTGTVLLFCLEVNTSGFLHERGEELWRSPSGLREIITYYVCVEKRRVGTTVVLIKTLFEWRKHVLCQHREKAISVLFVLCYSFHKWDTEESNICVE